jgi:hypothetical protein
MSKGSKRRPCAVSREQFEKNWDQVFETGGKERPVTTDNWSVKWFESNGGPVCGDLLFNNNAVDGVRKFLKGE